MKKSIFLFILIFTSINITAQSKITKASIKKIFRESEDKMQNGSFSYPTNRCWYFNNKDSVYFKRDTLVATFYKSKKNNSLCETITWTFHTENELVLHKESFCNEPPRFSALKFPDDYFWIAVYQVGKDIMIDLLRKDDRMIMESFKVIFLEEKKEYKKIILKRRFNHY